MLDLRDFSKVSAEINSCLSELKSLTYLDFSGQDLLISSTLHWLSSMLSLEYLSLREVYVRDKNWGSIIASLRHLKHLDLSNCFQPSPNIPSARLKFSSQSNFFSNIPSEIGNLSSLTYLDLSCNNISGSIPNTIGNLTSLEHLDLWVTALTGQIPPSLGNCRSLSYLDLNSNNLEGTIPSSLGLLINLTHLHLHILVMRSNNFRGILLPHIGRLPKLQVLDLSSNFFSGAIPRSYLTFPAMQKSSAIGAYVLNFYSYNDGVGTIASSSSTDLIVKGQERHYESVLSNFVCFDLLNNRLSGSLSPEIENLKGLMYFNVSMNNLSGPIPQSIGNLVQLESMDLSFNNFCGHISSELVNLTYLALLNLSYNHLSGKIPQGGGQMLTFDESSYRGNPNLWGCPLERDCSRPVARPSPPAVGVEGEREDGFEFPWYEMCFGLSWGVGFAGVVIVLVLKLSWRKKCFELMDRMIEVMDRMLLRHMPKPLWG